MSGLRKAVRAVVAVACFVAAAAAAQDQVAVPAADASAAEPLWAVRVPKVDKVVFRGVVTYDAAGLGTGPMLYPAPNAAGLLAAILTHALLSESAKQTEKNKLQADADGVLRPYEPVLATFTNERLVTSALPKLRRPERWRSDAGEAGAATQWLVETAPVFSMTSDQRALVLDNVVRVYRPGARVKADYGQTIRVVSAPMVLPASESGTPASVESLWLGDEGRRLTDESARLFAESLDVALADVSRPAGGDAPVARTFRYAEGGAEKMERAQLVEERCDRTLVRTLRGWLLSMPSSTAAPCAVADAEPAVR